MRANLCEVTACRNNAVAKSLLCHLPLPPSDSSSLCAPTTNMFSGVSLLAFHQPRDFYISFDLQLQMVCRCECGCLFVSLCQPCDETVTCPMCDPWTYYTNWILGCIITFVAMPKLRLLGLDLCPLVNVTVRVSVQFEVSMRFRVSDLLGSGLLISAVWSTLSRDWGRLIWKRQGRT